jgi:hypothetical protein
MINGHLSSAVALRAIYSLGCRAEGASENDKSPLIIDHFFVPSP